MSKEYFTCSVGQIIGWPHFNCLSLKTLLRFLTFLLVSLAVMMMVLLLLINFGWDAFWDQIRVTPWDSRFNGDVSIAATEISLWFQLKYCKYIYIYIYMYMYIYINRYLLQFSYIKHRKNYNFKFSVTPRFTLKSSMLWFAYRFTNF